MNRIDHLFKEKEGRVLSVYMTAGYPELNDTVEIITSLEQGGADMIEIGMPFSDPLADGPVIQASSQTALQNGMTIKLLFEQLKDIRSKVKIPLVLMGYLNPVLQFGFEKFLDKCVEIGIDGFILPDLPLSIYDKKYKEKVDSSGLHFIMLITPQTSTDRIKQIASASGGFLYMVADSSTTGAKKEIKDVQIEYFKRISSMNLDIPRLIGFGISSSETFDMACEHSKGAIIGSAFIKAIGSKNDRSISEKIQEFVRSITG
ncbi:MAG: tryptophan synthase subunit alpha [Bacteroidales bacterium]|jgi:tryptophan synthase alpha chain|nr:tryptophan synthase subunit alpha [Bacteroidales bacterium]